MQSICSIFSMIIRHQGLLECSEYACTCSEYQQFGFISAVVKYAKRSLLPCCKLPYERGPEGKEVISPTSSQWRLSTCQQPG